MKVIEVTKLCLVKELLLCSKNVICFSKKSDDRFFYPLHTFINKPISQITDKKLPLKGYLNQQREYEKFMASIPNPSLDAGLAALNQGNYSVAIAHLEGVRETELDETLVSRASQELVTAYRHNGDIEKAIALCQHLSQDPNPKLRSWADRNLVDLESQSSSTDSPGGFSAFDEAATANPQVNDSTGFVAFNPTPNKPKTPQASTTSSLKQRFVSSTKRLFPNSQSPNRDSTSTKTPAKKPSQVNPEAASRLPAHYSPPPTSHPSIFTPRPRWRNSPRAQNWSPLKKLKFLRLWLVQLVSAIAFFWVLRLVVQVLMATTNNFLVTLPFVEPIPLFYRDPTQGLAIFLLLLLALSPWLINGLLKHFHGLQSLNITQLSSRSPEAAQMIQSLCRQRRLPIPKLGLLPTDTPVILTYGNLPRTSRITVSEGLLQQLADDEIATIYAGQLGHIAHGDAPLMSLAVLILQIPYSIYWQVAQWGEQLPGLIERRMPSSPKFFTAIFVGITGIIASLSYGIYWLLQLPLVWFSRARVYYSDRLSVEATGNPNGMTRALLKIALGISDDIQTYGTTSSLLEGYDLLLPIGYRQALEFSSCSPGTPFERVLQWDCTNLYRDWLILSASHPLLGERLAMLARYAHFWKLDTELDLPPLSPPIRDNAARLSKLGNSYKALPLLQSTLLSGLVLGLLLRGLMWLIGQVGDKLNIWQLIWMHNARPFLDACILVAFSLSVFLWINRYFPDIKPSTVRKEPNLGDLLTNPATLPPDSQPLQLSGKLLGRRGVFNWLGQNLILQTSTGLVRLHFSSFLGPLGNILPLSTRPSNLVEQQVTVTGWFRRGATPWIDVETLRPASGKVIQAYYPIWITLLALVAAVWGAYQIWLA